MGFGKGNRCHGDCQNLVIHEFVGNYRIQTIKTFLVVLELGENYNFPFFCFYFVILKKLPSLLLLLYHMFRL